MNTWEIVALPQGDEIMKNGKVADTREAERILNNHERLVELLDRAISCMMIGIDDFSIEDREVCEEGCDLLAQLEVGKVGE